VKMSRWARGAAVVSLALLGRTVAAHEADGGLVGFVQNSHGEPVAGAMISLFGRGLGGSGLVTLSDSAGRFFVRSLPAGSYTLRALRDGHLPAPARKVTVLSDRDAMFTVRLTPLAEAAAAAVKAAAADLERETPAKSELRWLLRHKRRSVLEDRGGPDEATDSDVRATHTAALWQPDVDGTVEVLTTPAAVGVDPEPLGIENQAMGLSLLRLNGQLGSGRWSLSGLVADSESTTWRMAAQFVLEPIGGHEVEVGTGYGTRFLRPALPSDSQGRLDNRSVGALSVSDRWQVSDRFAAALGGRFSYIGFLENSGHLDPVVALEFAPDSQARLLASISSRTLVPGGDLLTLSTLASAPALAYARMDHDLRAERSLRVELGVEEAFGQSTLRAHTFYEGVRNQLANSYEGSGPTRALHIYNAGRVAARGMGITLGRRFGDGFRGSLSYTYGHSWRSAAPQPAELVLPRALTFREAGFHDLVARLEAAIDESDTRLVAFYRFNNMLPDADVHTGSFTSARFDVQLSQGLPFLGTVTRADWDFLLAVRNLYYEPDEGATLDELAVVNPPRRVLGGISVRF
jgi:hypothetical protein